MQFDALQKHAEDHILEVLSAFIPQHIRTACRKSHNLAWTHQQGLSSRLCKTRAGRASWTPDTSLICPSCARSFRSKIWLISYHRTHRNQSSSTQVCFVDFLIARLVNVLSDCISYTVQVKSDTSALRFVHTTWVKIKVPQIDDAYKSHQNWKRLKKSSKIHNFQWIVCLISFQENL